MDKDQGFTEEKTSPGRFILPSLITSAYATYPSGILTSILLIDIGLTFGYPIGVMTQIRTLSSIVAFVSAMLMGILSVRFKHKSLLLVGLLCLSVSALGSGSAVNLSMMFVFYAITGLGMAMVEPILSTLVADYFPLEKRSKVIGWVWAGGGLSWIIGTYVISFIASFGGWRLAFLGYAMILPLLGFVLASRGLPSLSHQSTISGENYVEAFKSVFSNRSAVACLIGILLASVSSQGIYFYSFSFLRQRYLTPMGWVAVICSAASICFFLGSFFSGTFVDKFGRKTMTVSGLLMFSLSTIFYTNLPSLGLSVVFTVIGHLFGALQYSAANSLSLEQVPRYRGSMMSINSAAYYMGNALGAGVGGFLLLLYNWNMLGIALGAIGIAATVIYHLLSIDPTRSKQAPM